MRSGFLTCLILLSTPVAAWAEPVVEIELLMRGRVQPTAAQDWSVRLAAAGFSRPTIRNARVGDEFQIETVGSQRQPVYRVTGYLMDDGSIMLPPRTRFGERDAAKLARWVRDLKDNGPAESAGLSGAFGLTAQRLEAVTQDLQRKVDVATKNQNPIALVGQLGRGLRYPLSIDAAARRALGVDAAVRDELKGLSAGTALAAVLRPAGLVLRPQFTAGRLHYAVLDSRTEGDNWPIGWAAEKAPGRVIPQLFNKEDTQQVEVPLSAALSELSGRLQIPFLFDHNNLARHRIDPERTAVVMRAGRLSYSAILNDLSRQAGLRYELRLDENKKPFLWFTTVRR